MDDLLERVRSGSRRAVAQVITRVERSDDAARQAVMALYPDTGQAHVVGVTGPPGSGKSTFVNELAKTLRRCDHQVGIIAVDPSSPFSGGALLGDRIRMRDLSGDPGIFIRSMATRGSLGGLARATAAVVKVMDAAQFDVILVETVGAGQAEVDIANTAHTTIVIEAPGMGDDIQSIKAGILEIADLLVVNKADRPGAASTVRALRMMLQMGHGVSARRSVSAQHADSLRDGSGSDDGAGRVWKIPVLETVATDGQGVDSVLDAILEHGTYLRESGEWEEREMDRSRQEVEQLLQAHVLDHLRAAVPAGERERLIADVAARELDPYTAVAQLFEQMAL